MNDISRAMGKKRAEKARRRYEVGAESGADWGLTWKNIITGTKSRNRAHVTKNTTFAETVHAVMDIQRKRLDVERTKKVGE